MNRLTLRRWLGAAFVASGILPLSGCGGASPTEPSRRCRRYATEVVVDGAPGTCRLDGSVYRCNAGGFLREWSYRNLSDFILEPDIPNRLLASGRQTSGGSVLVSSGGWTTTYTYDGLGRLIGRTRQGFSSFGSRDIDTVTYTGWDRLNRPVGGDVTSSDGTTIHVSLSYDDSARKMDVSNGETVTKDQDGNVVREVEFFDGASTNYVVSGSAMACQKMGESCRTNSGASAAVTG